MYLQRCPDREHNAPQTHKSTRPDELNPRLAGSHKFVRARSKAAPPSRSVSFESKRDTVKDSIVPYTGKKQVTF